MAFRSHQAARFEERKNKYYLMNLLPLHEMNVIPDVWTGKKPIISYKPAVLVEKSELDARKIIPGKTIYQLSGSPTIFERGGNVFGLHSMGDPFRLLVGVNVPEREWAFYTGGKLVASSK